METRPPVPPSEGEQKWPESSTPSEGGRGTMRWDVRLQVPLADMLLFLTFRRWAETTAKRLTFRRWERDNTMGCSATGISRGHTAVPHLPKVSRNSRKTAQLPKVRGNGRKRPSHTPSEGVWKMREGTTPSEGVRGGGHCRTALTEAVGGPAAIPLFRKE